MIISPWNPDHFRFVTGVLWSLIAFTVYYFLSRNKSLSNRMWKSNQSLGSQVKEVLVQRAWGLLFLGIISSLIISFLFRDDLRNFGLSFSFQASPPWWSYLLVPAILVNTYFGALNPAMQAMYPQFRIKLWTPGLWILNVISWIIFLIGYEMLFRGFLLYASLEVLDPWSSVALNCSIYSFAHIYKGPQETFGAIPVGMLLCYLTLLTGNIWTAVILHSVMALSYEWFSIRLNPEISWQYL